MAAPSLLYRKNTQFVTAILMDNNNQPVNDATWIAANLVDSTGAPVLTFPANMAMAYVPNSRGKYQGVLQGSFNPPVGSGYVLTIVGTAGGGASFSRDFPVTVIS